MKPSSSVEVRKIERADYPVVQSLITSIMQAEFPAEASMFPGDDLANIGHAYGSLGEAFFVAVAGKRIVGTIGVKREDERRALLRRIFVAASFRRKKIGSQLLDRAIHFCRDVGYQEIVIRTTTQMASAIDLCTKNGFMEKARLPIGPDHQLVKFTLFLKENSPLAR